MPADSPTVHIVDDEEPIRDSLEILLGAAGLQTRGWPSSVALLAACHALEPGCLLVDIRMPGMDGITLLENLRKNGVTLPVIIMTGHGDVPLAVRAMRAGAADFIEKPFSRAQLLGSLRAALGTAGPEAAAPENPNLARLSSREREVLEGLLNGLPNKTIGYDLGISPRTVEIHRARVMDKMGARSLSELVRLALAAGLKPAR